MNFIYLCYINYSNFAYKNGNWYPNKSFLSKLSLNLLKFSSLGRSSKLLNVYFKPVKPLRQGQRQPCRTDLDGWRFSKDRQGRYLEDGLPGRTDTWWIIMVSFCPLRIGMFPFQMAFLWLLNGGCLLTTYKSWDDPPGMISWNSYFCSENG